MTTLIIPDPIFLAAIGEIMPHDGDENMAVSLALAALSFLITIIVGRPLITWLRQNGVGKKIRLELTQHLDKAGTPTMGGVMITLTTVMMTLIFNTAGRLSMLLPIAVLVSVGTLGAIDDAMNLIEGKGEGMSGRFKMFWLVLVAVISAFVLHLPDPWGLGLHHMYIPYFGRFDIGWIYLPIAAFAIVAMANAVNLTDGLDSLAAGTAAVAFVSYGIIAYQQGQTAVVTLCFIMAGALMGFLWFNAPPAQVFMGDTGSLAIGALLAVAAFMTGQWLLLPIVGGVFVAETLSVMIQTGYYKYSRRKYGEPRRIFRMTPIHHHFEQMGWSRTQIALRFWLMGMMAGLLGVALALM